MSQTECVIGRGRHPLLCRWWLKTRELPKPRTIVRDGKLWFLPTHEFYVPLWAKPLDLLHRIIFGSSNLVKE